MISNLPGDPNCPICHGFGFIQQDLPVNHPEFGKLKMCSCALKSESRILENRLFQLSNLSSFQNMKFESYNPQGRLGLGDDQVNSLKYALNQSIHFSQHLQGWMLLMGGYGCGKTHLAAAIANFVVSLGIPTIFLTVPDLLDWIRYSFGNTEVSFEQRFEEIKNIQLLILDDLGTQYATPWAQEKLYQVINFRYAKKMATVITTNLDLEDIEGRIRSRLVDPDLVTRVEITAPDYRSPVVDSTHHEMSELHFHNRQTLGNFSLREPEKLSPEEQRSLVKAFKAAQQFAEKPTGWLVFIGSYGSGKTHLAAGIGNYRLALGESPMFVVVPDLLDHLRATFNPSSNSTYDRLFEQIRNCRLLIMDDLGTQSATNWAREKLYQIFNHRYVAELPTIITTTSTMDEMDPRIRSRMLDKRICDIYAIEAPAFRNFGQTQTEKPYRLKRSNRGEK
jgi:DNA replication protein DnaC